MNGTMYVGELTGQHLGKRVTIYSDRRGGDGHPEWSVRGVLAKVVHQPSGDPAPEAASRVQVSVQLDADEKPTRFTVGARELVDIPTY